MRGSSREEIYKVNDKTTYFFGGNKGLAERKKQERLGRIIPQTNEEYGYEDHYPLWAKGLGLTPPTRCADRLGKL